MTFLATRRAKDGNYSEKIEADSWAAAEAICRKKMWRLDGELIATIPVPVPSALPLVRLWNAIKDRLRGTKNPAR